MGKMLEIKAREAAAWEEIGELSSKRGRGQAGREDLGASEDDWKSVARSGQDHEHPLDLLEGDWAEGPAPLLPALGSETQAPMI